MKKSPMPCERRDLSSVTPDEPADDEGRKGECQTSGYVHSSPKKACYTTGTPIVLTGQRASFDGRLSYLFLLS